MKFPTPGQIWGTPDKPETFRHFTNAWTVRIWFEDFEGRPDSVSMQEWDAWARDKKVIPAGEGCELEVRQG